MATDVLAAHLQRVLLYVRLANDGGYYPTASEVDQYAIRSEPGPPTPQSLVTSAVAALAGSWYVTQGDPVVDYMKRVAWLQVHDSGGLRLTPLGTALVQGLEAEAHAQPEDRAVILRPDDPARYEVLIRTLASAKAGLLADPYLRAHVLELLADGTSLTRLLLSNAVPREEPTLFALGLWRLGANDQRRQLDVRVSSDQRFHDRYLLHEDGSLDLIGASVNSMDKRITAVVPLSTSIQRPLIDLLETLWQEATPIQPRDPAGPDSVTRGESPELVASEDEKPADPC